MIETADGRLLRKSRKDHRLSTPRPGTGTALTRPTENRLLARGWSRARGKRPTRVGISTQI